PKVVPLPEEVSAPEQTEYNVIGAFSPDGKLLAFWGADQQVRLWNVAGTVPEEVRRFRLDSLGNGSGLVLSPAVDKLVVCLIFRGFKVFDIRDLGAEPRLVQWPEGQTGNVRLWTFSRDGKTLAALRDQGKFTALFWDLSGPEPKALPERPLDPERERLLPNQ